MSMVLPPLFNGNGGGRPLLSLVLVPPLLSSALLTATSYRGGLTDSAKENRDGRHWWLPTRRTPQVAEGNQAPLAAEAGAATLAIPHLKWQAAEGNPAPLAAEGNQADAAEADAATLASCGGKSCATGCRGKSSAAGCRGRRSGVARNNFKGRNMKERTGSLRLLQLAA